MSGAGPGGLPDRPAIGAARRPLMTARGYLDALGACVIGFGAHTLGLCRLLFGVLADIALGCVAWRCVPAGEIGASIYRTGVLSLLPLGVVGYVVGALASLQLGVTLTSFGAELRVVDVIGVAVTSELGPLLAAVVLAGRAGASIAADIADVSRADTGHARQRQRLVSPRVLALMVTLPLLMVWTNAAEFLGGATAARLDLDLPFSLFLARLPGTITLFNFWLGLAKGVFFGLVIGVVASYFGLAARAEADNPGKPIARSVGVALALVLIGDVLIGAVVAKLGLS